MTTLYNGGPVMGGTFPALIWASVISAWEEIKAENLAAKKARKEGREASEGGESTSGETETYVPEETEAAPEVEEAPEVEAAPEEEVAPEATPEAAPEAAPEPSGGGGGVTAG
jgi:hypothetical protein